MTQSRHEKLQEYIRAHPGITVRQVINNHRREPVTANEVRAAMAGVPPAAKPTNATILRTVNSLLEAFDDVGKVQKTMKDLPRNQYIEDEEMRRKNSIAIGRWRDVCTQKALEEYRFKLPNGRHVWMHKAAQESLSAAINLSQQ